MLGQSRSLNVIERCVPCIDTNISSKEMSVDIKIIAWVSILAQLYSTCLACVRYWVLSPALQTF